MMQLLCLSLGPWWVSSLSWWWGHLSVLTLLSQTGSGPGFRGHQWGVEGVMGQPGSLDPCAG